VGESEAALRPSLEAEVDIDIEGVGVDEAGVFDEVDVAGGRGPLDARFFELAARVEIGAQGRLEIAYGPLFREGAFRIVAPLLPRSEGSEEAVVRPGEGALRRLSVCRVKEDRVLESPGRDAEIKSEFAEDRVVIAGFFAQSLGRNAASGFPVTGDLLVGGGFTGG